MPPWAFARRRRFGKKGGGPVEGELYCIANSGILLSTGRYIGQARERSVWGEGALIDFPGLEQCLDDIRVRPPNIDPTWKIPLDWNNSAATRDDFSIFLDSTRTNFGKWVRCGEYSGKFYWKTAIFNVKVRLNEISKLSNFVHYRRKLSNNTKIHA